MGRKAELIATTSLTHSGKWAVPPTGFATHRQTAVMATIMKALLWSHSLLQIAVFVYKTSKCFASWEECNGVVIVRQSDVAFPLVTDEWTDQTTLLKLKNISKCWKRWKVKWVDWLIGRVATNPHPRIAPLFARWCEQVSNRMNLFLLRPDQEHLASTLLMQTWMICLRQTRTTCGTTSHICDAGS